VSGANTNSPFDPNVSIPATNSANSASPSVSISTSNANDFIIGTFASSPAPTTLSAGSGFTLIESQLFQRAIADEYKIVSTTQTNLAISYSITGTVNWGMIGDAIQAGPLDTPNPFQQKIVFNPSTYQSYEGSALGNIRFCADSG